MDSSRFMLAAMCAVVLAVAADATIPVNNFSGRFTSPRLDPERKQGFYILPRNTNEASVSGWSIVAGQDKRADNTLMWCWQQDYRVCLLFDKKGNIAGTVVSASVDDVVKSKTEFHFDKSDEWFPQTLYNVKVYSTIAYYAKKAELDNGGRDLKDTDATYSTIELLRVTPGTAKEARRVAIGSTEKTLRDGGWNKQGCYPGQGYHWYDGLTKATPCEKLRTYFPMTNPVDGTLNALGVTIYSTVSDIRPWLEQQTDETTALTIKDGPKCLFERIRNYGLYTIHFFFNDQPWNNKC